MSSSPRRANVTSADGTTLAITRRGDGPPVVLVDGALAHRAINPVARLLAGRLAEAFAVHTYDRRGRGASDDASPGDLDPEREIEDLDAVAEHAGGGGAVTVFGASSGAILALDAAAAGVPMFRLALYEIPLIVDDSRAPLPADLPGRVTACLRDGDADAALVIWFAEVVRAPTTALQAMRRSPFWESLRAAAPSLDRDLALAAPLQRGEPLPEGRWAQVTVPTIVIDGGASARMIRSAADAVAQRLPVARRATLPGQTHDLDPDVLATELAARGAAAYGLFSRN
jgi:pimeloyl-ACP methyl ester carboxylesterase